MFLFRGVESHPRSITKAFSWRALGSIDTFVLSWLFTGNVSAAGAIASTEIFTKILLFYFHERIWALVPWGHVLTPEMREYNEKQRAASAPEDQPAAETGD
ncbi:DUF2061 domain-containing protein [Stakelama saccharophila]|uniref:DUF2061 domain-containing protein n=1 Tax=Stakelama saccharophila TaxID=3075605 RepID=A0ABZ0BBE4_9SPHN|nr:DUF2061 domain-containing protein [Stakelama sp. W311]WNO54370.1 DUF2061 domain-containing protein [Stakelama sp. W311]